MVPQLHKGDTEEFKGRLVPKFPDMEEDTRLPGVSSTSTVLLIWLCAAAGGRWRSPASLTTQWPAL
jgi:hypothetical protein